MIESASTIHLRPCPYLRFLNDNTAFCDYHHKYGCDTPIGQIYYHSGKPYISYGACPDHFKIPVKPLYYVCMDDYWKDHFDLNRISLEIML